MEIIWIVVAIIVVFIGIKLTTNKRPAGAPPQLSGGLPIVGHFLELKNNPNGLAVRARKECGNMCSIRLLGMELNLVLSRELIAPYFAFGEDNLSFDAIVMSAREVLLEDVSFPSNIPIVKAANHNYDARIEEYITNEIAKLPQTGELDIHEWSRSLICQISFLMLLGKTIPPEVEKALLLWEEGVINYLGARRILPSFLASLLYRAKAIKPRSKIMDTVESVVQTMDESELPVYITAFKEIHRSVTSRAIANSVASAAFAAVTNSALAVGEALVRVALHPELAASFLGDLQSSDANNLCQAWSLECARLSGGFSSISRVCTGEHTTLGGYHIPKGAMVLLATHMLSREENCFANPTTFDPARFLPEKVAAGSVPKANAILLWGGGQHLCPGKRFALSEMRGALRVVLSKLKLEPVDIAPLKTGMTSASVARRERPAIVRYTKK